MKKLLCLLIAALSLWVTGLAQAYTLSFDPSTQDIPLGGTAQVNLNLDLGATETLYSFDIDLTYDPTVLDFASVFLGAAVSGWLDASAGFVVPGLVNIFAFDFSAVPTIPPVGISNGLFTLATFDFTGRNYGTSLMTAIAGPSAVGDGYLEIGLFNFVTANASADVNVVPEPSTWLLLGVGLASLVVMRRKYGRA